MIWGVVFVLFCIFIILAYSLGHVRGKKEGKEIGYTARELYWDKLKKTPIAGQYVDVPHFGMVIILGRGEINGVPHIDYIPKDVVGDRQIPELSEEELDRNVISCPLDEFCAQCELSISMM